jgi:hypothetical protein
MSENLSVKTKKTNFITRIIGNILFLANMADLVGIKPPRHLGLKILGLLCGLPALGFALYWACHHINISFT